MRTTLTILAVTLMVAVTVAQYALLPVYAAAPLGILNLWLLRAGLEVVSALTPRKTSATHAA